MDIKSFLQEKLLTEKDFVLDPNKNNGSRQSLWHGLKPNHAAEAIKLMELVPHTSQRFWPNGQRLKENHPDYENSYWMYGWSTTRKKEYAMNWGEVVFELDHEKIQQNFEIKPFSWNYLFKHVNHMKKHEFEEFIISHYFNRSIPDLKREQEERDNLIDQLLISIRDIKNQEEINKIKKEIEELEKIPSWFKIWESPKGKNLNLNNCLKGIYIEDFLMKESKLFEKDLSVLIEHELFKGTFSREKLSNKNNNKLKV